MLFSVRNDSESMRTKKPASTSCTRGRLQRISKSLTHKLVPSFSFQIHPAITKQKATYRTRVEGAGTGRNPPGRIHVRPTGRCVVVVAAAITNIFRNDFIFGIIRLCHALLMVRMMILVLLVVIYGRPGLLAKCRLNDVVVERRSRRWGLIGKSKTIFVGAVLFCHAKYNPCKNSLCSYLARYFFKKSLVDHTVKPSVATNDVDAFVPLMRLTLLVVALDQSSN
jgi:hypothetical protein